MGGADELLQRRLLARDGRERRRVARKGSRVVVTGRLEQRSWETENGEKRSVVEIVADEVGPSLRWATAQVTRNERKGGGDFGGGCAGSGGSGGGGGGSPGSRRLGRRRPPNEQRTTDFGEEPF